MMLIKVGNSKDVEATPEMKKSMQEQSRAVSMEKLTGWIHIFNQAQHAVGSRWQPSLALGMAIVECLQQSTQASSQISQNVSQAVSKPKEFSTTKIVKASEKKSEVKSPTSSQDPRNKQENISKEEKNKGVFQKRSNKTIFRRAC